MTKKHLRPREASQFLNDEFGIRRAASTLAKQRCWGGDAPNFRRIGRAIYYSESDLRTWAERALGTAYRNTSDSGYQQAS